MVAYPERIASIWESEKVWKIFIIVIIWSHSTVAIGTNLMLVISPVSDDSFGTYTFALITEKCGTATAVSRIIRQGQF